MVLILRTNPLVTPDDWNEKMIIMLGYLNNIRGASIKKMKMGDMKVSEDGLGVEGLLRAEKNHTEGRHFVQPKMDDAAIDPVTLLEGYKERVRKDIREQEIDKKEEREKKKREKKKIDEGSAEVELDFEKHELLFESHKHKKYFLRGNVGENRIKEFVRRGMERIGKGKDDIARASVMSLRRAHALSLRENGCTLEEIRLMSGWANAAMVEHYAGRTTTETRGIGARLLVRGILKIAHRASRILP